jgi:hypothetical protein
MSLTTDRNDPQLTHGVDTSPTPQSLKYLILSDEERAKGFVRPYRDAYTHVGPPGPESDLRDITEEERDRFGDMYAKFEPYPAGSSSRGRFWTQQQLDQVGKGCRVSTKMARELSETYAREPRFYGATYCVGCSMHLPVVEFTWNADGERVGS